MGVKDMEEAEFKEMVSQIYGKHNANKFWKRHRKEGKVPQDKIEKLIDNAKDVFLSHNWGKDEKGRDNHARVVKISEYLTSKGFRCWIDAEEMTGNLDKKMSSGIDASRMCIAFITDTYLKKTDGEGDGGESDNCFKEFQYSSKAKGPQYILPVIMEDDLMAQGDWYGPVALSLNNKIYCPLTADEDNEEEWLKQCVGIEKELLKKLKKPFNAMFAEEEYVNDVEVPTDELCESSDEEEFNSDDDDWVGGDY